jgi:hypothetical protein
MSNNGAFNSFSTNTGTFGPREFLESNSLVSKFAFLILILFVFIILLKIGVYVIGWFHKPSTSPRLINGMVDATQMIIFPQDPSNNNAVTVFRSINENQGLEFSWSVWILISNLQDNSGIYKHIFSKGNSNLNENGVVSPNNAPGLYIAPDTNALVIMMNTYKVINEEIVIPDIPMNKWVNVILRCQGTKLDVYINGTIARSINMVSVPKQNYGDVFVAMNGGFNGYISNLWYYNYSLGTAAIQQLVARGPNTKMIGSSGLNDKSRDYLSLRWFFYGDNDFTL